jgi:AcrR family transcriptional regulator
MSDRINRKDLIIAIASDLFLQQGYEATSIRQIADEVGVTEAALYYHFKDGKRELLQAVFACQMPNFKQILDKCSGSGSLSDLLHCYEQEVTKLAPQIIPQVRWHIREYSNLGEERQNFLHLKQLSFYDALADLILATVH